MSKHCVQCGQQKPLYLSNRCAECFEAWDAAGRVIAEPWKNKTGWGAIGGVRYHNVARFCRDCGARLEDPERAGYRSRVRYALSKGGECVRCDDCYYENHPRAILRRPRTNPLPPPPCPSPTKSSE